MKSIAIIGCGDFLRWQAPDLEGSLQIRVSHLVDPDLARAQAFATRFGAQALATADPVWNDPTIDIVALFVPPWLRKPLFLRAAAAGKHVIATKPLASSVGDCEEMLAAATSSDIRAGMLYSRSGDAFVETARDVLTDGSYGRLALYRQDWIHAYPQWNRWATDPEKNGGPFMDAMIHNLNAACYLMDRPVTGSALFSDRLSHPQLPCADTESMLVRFEGGGLAHLFITWAADLATHSTEGNDREHIDIFYLVTDRGWRITKEWRDGAPVLIASREGKQETISCQPAARTPYDAFAAHLEGAPFPRVLATLGEGARDLRLTRQKPAQLP